MSPEDFTLVHSDIVQGKLLDEPVETRDWPLAARLAAHPDTDLLCLGVALPAVLAVLSWWLA